MNLCVWWGISSLSSRTGSRVVDQLRTVFLCCEATIGLKCNVSAYRSWWSSTCFIDYNFQRRMSRLEQRWRAQRSVISIVNCRIPWTNRDLNVYCAFGISLKACLLQCLLIFMPPAHSKAIWYCRVCVFVCQGALCPWRIQCTGAVHNKQFE